MMNGGGKMVYTNVEVKANLRVQVTLEEGFALTIRLDWFDIGDIFDFIDEEEYNKILETFPWAEDSYIDWIAGKVIQFLKVDPKTTQYNGIEKENEFISVQLYLKDVDRQNYIVRELTKEILNLFNLG